MTSRLHKPNRSLFPPPISNSSSTATPRPPQMSAPTVPSDYLSSRSIELLQNARENTEVEFLDEPFDSETFRTALSDSCLKATGYRPYSWQLDATEASFLGLNTVVTAGTSYGKSLPFGLLHLQVADKVTIVISPLNALEFDLVRHFRGNGVASLLIGSAGEAFRSARDCSVRGQCGDLSDGRIEGG